MPESELFLARPTREISLLFCGQSERKLNSGIHTRLRGFSLCCNNYVYWSVVMWHKHSININVFTLGKKDLPIIPYERNVNPASNNNNNNNNFISVALLSYVQGALQSCKQHYWKIFTNLQPYPIIFTMSKKGKN